MYLPFLTRRLKSPGPVQIRQFRLGEPVGYAFIFLVGLVFFLLQFLTWAIPQLASFQKFVPSHGTVLETRVREKSDGSVKLYRPEVYLEHVVRGTSYRIWTFDFRSLKPDDGFVVDRNLAESRLLPFAIGRRVDCWYREDDPTQAIVQWNLSVWGWFFLLFSFSLVVLGLVGFSQSFRLKPVSEERRIVSTSSSLQTLVGGFRSAEWPTVPDIRVINDSPGTHLAYRMPLGSQPIFPLVGLTLFAVAWNAVAWSVMFHSFLTPQDGWSDRLIGILFRGLFCGVGIVLFAWVVHRIFQAFSIGPTLLEISDHPLYPGRRYRILFQQSGVLRFRELAVDVVCEEIARFRQGTDTVTNRKDVFRQRLFGRKDFETTADMPLHREFFLQLPLDAMHSFRQANNEIAWKIEVLAQTAGRPFLLRECPIVVRPAAHNDLVQEGEGL